eukprot:GHRR01004723.1.p1 GENE.GHRR01004723.1~~GHRR01004723.1.p1  ORF type:complete len:2002 (+),score=973.92 GHRR01004723.1:289-6294(+)
MLRYSTAAVAQRGSRHRRWLWAGAGIAATASAAVVSHSTPYKRDGQDANAADTTAAASPLDKLGQSLSRATAAFWPSNNSITGSKRASSSSNVKDQVLNHVRATSARWLAQWAKDTEAREALLAFGGNCLLDFLLETATEEPSLEQDHAEQALVNFLGGHHTATRLLARPGAIPRLLHHVGSGRASKSLLQSLVAVLDGPGADMSQGLSLDDGRALVAMLQLDDAPEVQQLSLMFLTGWAAASQAQRGKLAAIGLAPALGRLAIEAVGQGEQGRPLQAQLCRLQRMLLLDPATFTDADLATWMQPLLFMAADAAAAAAAATTSSHTAASAATANSHTAAAAAAASDAAPPTSSSQPLPPAVIATTAPAYDPLLGTNQPLGALHNKALDSSLAGALAAAEAAGRTAFVLPGVPPQRGLAVAASSVELLPAVDDLTLADAAMTNLALAVVSGGPLVKAALQGLHLMPTLDCLALSPDPAIKARTAAALAALVSAGQLHSEKEQQRWRDTLLSWLMASTSGVLQNGSMNMGVAVDSTQQSGSSSNAGTTWVLRGWYNGDSTNNSSSNTSSSYNGDASVPADAALARSCVAALKALSQQEGPLGLSVAQLWLARLLSQLSGRVAAYTSITTLLPQTAASSLTAAAAPVTKATQAPFIAGPLGWAAGSIGSGRIGNSSGRQNLSSLDVQAGLQDVLAAQACTAAGLGPAVGAAAGASEGVSVPGSSSNGAGSASRAQPIMGAVVQPAEPVDSLPGSLQPGPDLVAAPAPAATSASSGWWPSSWWWSSKASTPTSSFNTQQHRQQQQLEQTNGNAAGPDITAISAEDVWGYLDAARPSQWRDAAPVTPAYAKAAAEDLKAASQAMLGSWKAAALALPSDLMPGMFAPAVTEAYPAAARVTDYVVAQQRTCTVLELLASVVAEDPAKQAWLFATGILPLMERLVLHADAALEPEAFIAKYNSTGNSSSSSGSRDNSNEERQQGDNAASSSSSSSDGWWGWRPWGSNQTSADSTQLSGPPIEAVTTAPLPVPLPAVAAALQCDGKMAHASSAPSSAASVRPDNEMVQQSQSSAAEHKPALANAGAAFEAQHLQGALMEDTSAYQGYEAAVAAQCTINSCGRDQSIGIPCDSVSKSESERQLDFTQSGPTHCVQTGCIECVDQHQHVCNFGSDGQVERWYNNYNSSGTESASNAASATAFWFVDRMLSRFTAAALTTSASSNIDSSSNSACSSSLNEQAAATAAPNTAAASFSSQNPQATDAPEAAQPDSTRPPNAAEKQPSAANQAAKPQPRNCLKQMPGTGLVAFAQDGRDLDAASQNPSQLDMPSSAAADAATAITAAAEEVAIWSDGDALGVIGMQRQVARILSMLALQPEAADQLATAALRDNRGALNMLQGIESNSDSTARLQPAVGAQMIKVRPSKGSSSGSGSHLSSRSAWLPWLVAAAASDDCLLSSYAATALLHLESTMAYHGSHLRQHNDGNRCSGEHGSDNSSSDSSIGSRWKQRLMAELETTEVAAFLEEIWPFSGSKDSSNSSSKGGRAWRPPVFYPDGIFLINPTSQHHWSMLRSPPASLLESLGAAATAAASAAAVAAASDLSDSDIQLSDTSFASSAAAAAGAAAAAAVNAAAAAAAAAASALGADTSQLQHGQGHAVSSTAGSSAAGSAAGNTTTSSSNDSNSSCVTDLGLLQPAVSWLAYKLVKFARIKEQQVQQQQQQKVRISSGESIDVNPAAPLGTYATLQALVSDQNSTTAGVAGPESSSNGANGNDGQAHSGSSNTSAFHKTASIPPEFDVVFIHGIRGGPFVTWRRGGARQLAAQSSNTTSVSSSTTAGSGSSSCGTQGSVDPGASSGVDSNSSSSNASSSGRRKGVPLLPSAAAAMRGRHMTQADCWPSAWLAADLPGARLLSVEYKAPVTGWEGESLSLPDCGRLLLDKLIAAGVGQRPVVFVAHSMGGLLVKEMLSLSLDEPANSPRGRLAAATKAIAFYSTPHFGSSMAALGWKLRHLPGV